MHIPDDALKSIGDLLVFITDECLHEIDHNHVFDTNCNVSLEEIRKFGRQLLLTEDTGLLRLMIPAFSALVNKVLNPHCDGLNPYNYSHDYTFSICVGIQTESIMPVERRQIIQAIYPEVVPFCIVAYGRNALICYAKRQNNIEQYMRQNESSIFIIRQKLVNLLKSSYSDSDYIGSIFMCNDRLELASKFKEDTKCYFKKPLYTTKEAVDKMVSQIKLC